LPFQGDFSPHFPSSSLPHLFPASSLTLAFCSLPFYDPEFPFSFPVVQNVSLSWLSSPKAVPFFCFLLSVCFFPPPKVCFHSHFPFFSLPRELVLQPFKRPGTRTPLPVHLQLSFVFFSLRVRFRTEDRLSDCPFFSTVLCVFTSLSISGGCCPLLFFSLFTRLKRAFLSVTRSFFRYCFPLLFYLSSWTPFNPVFSLFSPPPTSPVTQTDIKKAQPLLFFLFLFSRNAVFLTLFSHCLSLSLSFVPEAF